jgi:hypothetical protein
MEKKKFNDFEDELKLYRYMGLSRFLDILRTKTLFFASADMFADPYEGSIPVQDAITRFKSANPKASSRIEDYTQPELLSSDPFQALTKWVKISCWYRSIHESESMWRLYNHGEKECIAISTTAGAVMNAITPYRIKPEYGSETVWLGNVKYLDYKKDRLPKVDDLNRFFYKRSCFKSEEEFRVAISLVKASEYVGDTPNKGIRVAVDIDQMIDSICVSPLSDFDIVEKRLREAGWQGTIRRSSIDSSPIF